MAKKMGNLEWVVVMIWVALFAFLAGGLIGRNVAVACEPGDHHHFREAKRDQWRLMMLEIESDLRRINLNVELINARLELWSLRMKLEKLEGAWTK